METTSGAPQPPKSVWKRWPARITLGLLVFYLLLLIPDTEPPKPRGAGKTPFTWNQPQFWAELEQGFKNGRQVGCQVLAPSITTRTAQLRDQLGALAATRLTPDAPLLGLMETNLFTLASEIAACPEELPGFIELCRRLRTLLKNQSQRWDVNSTAARARLYRLLYGGRAALEEIMLQAPPHSWPAIMPGHDEPSQTPFASLLGVRIHSGDILVSRGTAPSSALIARGNDYPGNFSHIALAHIDPATREVSLVEAHIEQGVTVTPLEDYLNDRKSRLMILRLRSDLPQLAEHPSLPHQAATQAMERARNEHTPYDFAMDHDDPHRLFCSEVASAAYKEFGVTLWSSHSFLSGTGVTSWLAAFGVSNFETQEPADLEYDPQLRVIAEWRDPDSLFLEHLDNAVIDAMLEQADAGMGLDYSLPLLPVVRVVKAYSVLLNLFGKVGPVPEGMTATAALRNKRFSKAHQTAKLRLITLADDFKRNHGYPPPHATLLELARQTVTSFGSPNLESQFSILK